jgi:hypothetical protein
MSEASEEQLWNEAMCQLEARPAMCWEWQPDGSLVIVAAASEHGPAIRVVTGAPDARRMVDNMPPA